MSGHSKWATTKRHKAAIDAKRGKKFSMLGKELTICAKSGGGDPEFNPSLRTIIAAAKAANMPSDNIERAIKKGTGELPGATIEEFLYEGYAQGGVGVIVEVTTDNKNRSASEVRSAFTKNGGNLAGAGALSYNFHRKGHFLFALDKISENDLLELALENGAEDVKTFDDHYEVFCPITEFDHLSHAFQKKNLVPASAELAYIPNTLIEITDPEMAKKIVKLTDALEELDDVKNVFANYDIDEKLLEEA